MTKSKRIMRKRRGAPGEETAGESSGSRKPWISVLRRGARPRVDGALRPRHRVWRSIRSTVATAVYNLFGEIAGLSEARPALGRAILARVLTALGAPAPRVAVSVTIGRSRGEILGLLRGVEEMWSFSSRIQQVEIAKDQDTARFTFRDDARRAPARRGALLLTRAPGGQGTEVKAILSGKQSVGWLARAVAGLLAEVPRQRLLGDLRRIEQCAEIGAITTNVGQPSGRKAV
jgi:uncharacterized membrane protein